MTYVTAGDVVGLLATGFLLGVALGLWFGWRYGFLAGEDCGRKAAAKEVSGALNNQWPWTEVGYKLVNGQWKHYKETRL